MSYEAARSAGAPGAPLLITAHGTGGTEDQFHAPGRDLMPGAHVVSPRGDLAEQGHLRFFRRTAEGVYDMADLARAVEKMAGFIAAEQARTGAATICALGYSNGANILAATAMTHPGLMDGLVLFHPLIPWTPDPQPGLAGTRILVTAGERDPICPAPLTRSYLDWLHAQGAEVTEHWHSGGHDLRPEELTAAQAHLHASLS